MIAFDIFDVKGGKSELHRAEWSLTATVRFRRIRKVPQKIYRPELVEG